MRLCSTTQLIDRLFEEYSLYKSIAEVPKGIWYNKPDKRTVSIFDQDCETPLGPAAGPHTQLAINIIASYLTGSRFIELKTVQILDSLEIDKPCIHIPDEGFNTEWSTELSLEEAWEEYTKAWILLHFIEGIFKLKRSDNQRSFMFNMSVGYDLKGIQSKRVDTYIMRMKDSDGDVSFSAMVQEALYTLSKWCPILNLNITGKELEEIAASISGKMCSSVTLSTMHGCPKDEIEKIAAYLLEEKQLDTYVKLNPTLLGYEKVREILDGLGYSYVKLNKEGFKHDLLFEDAVQLVGNLITKAENRGRFFGVKLTNTLASANTLHKLPGEEMYMSGRTLFPLSINVALELSRYFKGKLPISFSGGISVQNAAQVFKSGIRPVTVATEMLKPGGYGRMLQIAQTIDSLPEWDYSEINISVLEELAEDSLHNPEYHKDYRGFNTAHVAKTLPEFDCYIAPCIAACPVGQDVPGYIALAAAGEYEKALACIYKDNPLPGITGHICNHECQDVCTRIDYEGTVRIRDIKKCITELGRDDYEKNWSPPKITRSENTAIIGAGPAGLSAAYFLANAGFPCTVFEREPAPGGVVGNIIPKFRIPERVIENDVLFIKRHGVEFVYGIGDNLSAEDIIQKGYRNIIIATGTYSAKPVEIAGDNDNRYHAYNFLRSFNTEKESLNLGKSVAVIGAGDTAMDCARAALRCEGVKESTIIYRRSEHEMPASEEEYRLALQDGVKFLWLTKPHEFKSDGTLITEKTELGEPDESGRRRPVGTGKYVDYAVDTIIYAVGDDPDTKTLNSMGFDLSSKEIKTKNYSIPVVFAGDVRTGSTSIIAAENDGRNAARAVAERYGVSIIKESDKYISNDATALLKKRISMHHELHTIEPPKEKTDHVVQHRCSEELERCLQCNSVCNKCVDVCPNRSNIAVPISGMSKFSQHFQIVHIDAFCNECGNCGFYCPYDGNPYLDKPTVFSTLEDFEHSSNPGWYISGKELIYRFGGEVKETEVKNTGMLSCSEDKNTARFFSLFETLYATRKELFSNLQRRDEK